MGGRAGEVGVEPSGAQGQDGRYGWGRAGGHGTMRRGVTGRDWVGSARGWKGPWNGANGGTGRDRGGKCAGVGEGALVVPWVNGTYEGSGWRQGAFPTDRWILGKPGPGNGP